MQKIWKRLLDGIVPWSSNFLDWCLVGRGDFFIYITSILYKLYNIYLFLGVRVEWCFIVACVFSAAKNVFYFVANYRLFKDDNSGRWRREGSSPFRNGTFSRPKGDKSWKWNVKTHQRLVVSNRKCGKTHGYTWLHHPKVPSSPQKFNLPLPHCHVLLFNRDALFFCLHFFSGVFTKLVF